MNWDKSANLIIICLLILNAMLGFMNYMSGQKYTLSESQEQALVRLLNKNNIELGEIIRDFAPVRTINMLPFAYDNESIRTVFLGNSENIRRTSEFMNTKYTGDNETLVISPKVIEYTNEHGSGEIDFTTEAAKALAADYYRSVLSGKFAGFSFNTVFERDNAIIVDYRGYFKNNIIYSNYIRFTITENGIVAIVCEYQKPESFYGTKKQICSPDEALVTFMHEMRKESYESIFVSKMDLVYYLVETSEQGNELVRATPFYRIYVDGNHRPVLINAFTNTIL